MKKVEPYRISYFKLDTCKKKFKLGDNLVVLNPNFSKSGKEIISDIFDKVHIQDLEYEYFIDYMDASISIHFGIII